MGYYDRKQVFSKKKLLKGKSISITESLTSFRMKEIEEAREKHGFVLLFALGVIVNWGNCTSCFFQSNDKWVYDFNRNIFIFNFYILLFFYIKIFFSLTTYDIPFLQIHTTIYFLLVSCYIINVNQ